MEILNIELCGNIVKVTFKFEDKTLILEVSKTTLEKLLCDKVSKG